MSLFIPPLSLKLIKVYKLRIELQVDVDVSQSATIGVVKDVYDDMISVWNR